jgi:hypothetical protein
MNHPYKAPYDPRKRFGIGGSPRIKYEEIQQYKADLKEYRRLVDEWNDLSTKSADELSNRAMEVNRIVAVTSTFRKYFSNMVSELQIILNRIDDNETKLLLKENYRDLKNMQEKLEKLYEKQSNKQKELNDFCSYSNE